MIKMDMWLIGKAEIIKESKNETANHTNMLPCKEKKPSIEMDSRQREVIVSTSLSDWSMPNHPEALFRCEISFPDVSEAVRWGREGPETG